MHYYAFNIGDYKSHTSHLDPIEDIAYRRLLDWCYLHEKPLPKSIDEIERLINMRTHSESIATVLKEFFYIVKGKGWFHRRVEKEITAYTEKSEKARNSAKARWGNKKGDANAMRTQSERNAKHKPITNNHKPVNNKQKTIKFKRPGIDEITQYIHGMGFSVNPNTFFNHYESNGWKVGRNSMKNWKAAVSTWETKNGQKNGGRTHSGKPVKKDYGTTTAGFLDDI